MYWQNYFQLYYSNDTVRWKEAKINVKGTDLFERTKFGKESLEFNPSLHPKKEEYFGDMHPICSLPAFWLHLYDSLRYNYTYRNTTESAEFSISFFRCTPV